MYFLDRSHSIKLEHIIGIGEVNSILSGGGPVTNRMRWIAVSPSAPRKVDPSDFISFDAGPNAPGRAGQGWPISAGTGMPVW